MDEKTLLLLGELYAHYSVKTFVCVVGYVMSSIKRMEHVCPKLMMHEELRPFALAVAASRKFPDFDSEVFSGIKEKVDQMGIKNPSLKAAVQG